MTETGEFVKQHPNNPRYFLFRGEPLALVTAGEHYGAVINLGFDYTAYLDVLKEKGFRLTRIFLFYREQPGSCSGLEMAEGLYFSELGNQNTLAPAAESYLSPWPRRSEPGCYDGGNKFDVSCLNDAFFDRLKDFCRQAGDRGILVEVTLFSNFYSNSETGPWRVCPLNAINNINGVGQMPYHEFMSLEHDDVVHVLEELVRRTVQELRDLDNIYYEICNEPNPFPQDPHLEYAEIARWQNHFASMIVNLERDFVQKHMIAVCDPNEDYDLTHVSILNFHYREWAEKGLQKYGGGKLILAFDETLTGIVAWNRTMDFQTRRREAWTHIMRGFGVYNYLDFTYATDDPEGEGKAAFPANQYYNGETMRLYLKHLNDFMGGMNFVSMHPDNSFIASKYSVASAYGLADPGKAYAVYIDGDSVKYLALEMPEGKYNVQWFHPRVGAYSPALEVMGGGEITLEVPLYEQDIALKIARA